MGLIRALTFLDKGQPFQKHFWFQVSCSEETHGWQGSEACRISEGRTDHTDGKYLAPSPKVQQWIKDLLGLGAFPLFPLLWNSRKAVTRKKLSGRHTRSHFYLQIYWENCRSQFPLPPSPVPIRCSHSVWWGERFIFINSIYFWINNECTWSNFLKV